MNVDKKKCIIFKNKISNILAQEKLYDYSTCIRENLCFIFILLIFIFFLILGPSSHNAFSVILLIFWEIFEIKKNAVQNLRKFGEAENFDLNNIVDFEKYSA